MGAGHDGAARELARRLRSDGHQVEVRDFLAAPPRPIGRVLRRSYEWELRYAAWSYELTYRLWIVLPVLVTPLSRFIALLSRPQIRRWIDEFDADIVVSVYPLASQALGVMRHRGQLRVPVVTYLTDFAVHPVWVHPAVDLHLAVHPSAAADAARQAGGPAGAPGPLVSPTFRMRMAKRERAATRTRLGIGDDDRAVLIVAGSWGVGAVAETFELVARCPEYVPVIVCGRQERLRRRLARTGVGTVIGWTDEMPGLMAACDVLIENAGGLTSLEAMASGLPVVTYQPIPGHGRENTRLMHAAGVARRATDGDELRAALDELSVTSVGRRRQVMTAKAMWAGDAAADIVALADATAPALRPVVVPPRRHRPV